MPPLPFVVLLEAPTVAKAFYFLRVFLYGSFLFVVLGCLPRQVCILVVVAVLEVILCFDYVLVLALLGY